MILKRRINQRSELKKISRIKNETLRNVLTAFELVKMNTSKKEDIAAFSRCESYRNKLLTDNRLITYEVFSQNKTAKVKDICKAAASKKKWCQFLYQLAKNTENPSVLEIGTNLGISGSYILEAIKGRNGKLVTMEGLPQLCEISAEQFSTIIAKSCFEIIQGLYDETFPKVVEKGLKYNLLFIDGNHKKEATLDYFNTLKSKIDQTAIFVFDDIYWSDGMNEAWKIIRNDRDTNFSIDLYEQGVVVIDKGESLHHRQFNLHLAY